MLRKLIGYHSQINSLLNPCIKTNIFQVFASNPQAMSLPNFNFFVHLLNDEFSNYKFIFHGPFTVNFIRSRQDTWNYTFQYIKEFFKITNILWKTSPLLILHTGKPDREYSNIDDFSKNRFLDFFKIHNFAEIKNLNLAIETDASSICHITTLRGLFDLFNNIKLPGLSICLDTAHSWSSGFDIFNNFTIDKYITLISCIHLNAIKKEVDFGSGIDRHGDISFEESAIPNNWIKHYLHLSKIFNIPIILERHFEKDIISDYNLISNLYKEFDNEAVDNKTNCSVSS